jgi:hypothetical protein
MTRKLSDKEGLTSRHCYICITRRRKDALMRMSFIRVIVNGRKHGYKQKLGSMSSSQCSVNVQSSLTSLNNLAE